jgi:hypothetical protein
VKQFNLIRFPAPSHIQWKEAISGILEGEMARTCVWCGDPLPEPEQKGHRRREFCKRPKNCKQQHYLWHKKMKHDADALADPYWRAAYQGLVERYKWLENMVQARLLDMEELEKEVQYYKKRAEDIQIDYVARLRGLGISEEQIKEFDEYWRRQLEEQWKSHIEP